MNYKLLRDITYCGKPLMEGAECDFEKLSKNEVAGLVKKGYIEPVQQAKKEAKPAVKTEAKS